MIQIDVWKAHKMKNIHLCQYSDEKEKSEEKCQYPSCSDKKYYYFEKYASEPLCPYSPLAGCAAFPSFEKYTKWELCEERVTVVHLYICKMLNHIDLIYRKPVVWLNVKKTVISSNTRVHLEVLEDHASSISFPLLDMIHKLYQSKLVLTFKYLMKSNYKI